MASSSLQCPRCILYPNFTLIQIKLECWNKRSNYCLPNLIPVTPPDATEKVVVIINVDSGEFKSET